MNEKASGTTVVDVKLEKELAALIGRNSYQIIGSSIDKSIIGAIKDRGAYEPHILSVIGKTLPKGGIFVDVGANIGVLSVFAGLLVGESGLVLAIEASPSNCEYLRRNILLNDCPNINAVNVGIWDCPTILTFSYVPEVAGCSFFSTTNVQNGIAEVVNCDSLDTVLKNYGYNSVDLIKVDIEGAEIKLLNGGGEVFGKMRPKLIIEINPVTLQRFFNATLKDIYEAIIQYNYSLKSIYKNGELEYVRDYNHLEGLFTKDAYLEFLCEPR